MLHKLALLRPPGTAGMRVLMSAYLTSDKVDNNHRKKACELSTSRVSDDMRRRWEKDENNMKP